MELTRNANMTWGKNGHFCLLNNFLFKDCMNVFTVEFQTEGNPIADNLLNNASISFIVTPPTSVSAYYNNTNFELRNLKCVLHLKFASPCIIIQFK